MRYRTQCPIYQSFGYQVRFAHFTTKTPAKNGCAIFGFAHPPPVVEKLNQNFRNEK